MSGSEEDLDPSISPVVSWRAAEFSKPGVVELRHASLFQSRLRPAIQDAFGTRAAIPADASELAVFRCVCPCLHVHGHQPAPWHKHDGTQHASAS